MSALLGANVSSGQDMAYLTIDISMRDLYAIQKEFIQYVNIDELLPKLISKGLLSDNEMYMVKNPYLPPDQRISMLFQYISSKGPKGPSRLVECLTERPLVPGHMYLASRLAGDSKLGERTLLSCVFFSFLITLFESCCYYYMCMVKQMKLHIIAFICYYNISSALTHLLLYQLCPANKDYRVRFIYMLYSITTAHGEPSMMHYSKRNQYIRV